MGVSKEVIFVRHGECETNANHMTQAGVFEQVDGDPLTERGQKQAKLTAEYIAQFPQFPIEAVLSSAALRARMTAKVIAEEIVKGLGEEVTVTQAVPLLGKRQVFEVGPEDTDQMMAHPSLLREIDNPGELHGLSRDDPRVLRVKQKMERIHSVNVSDATFRQHYSDEENLYDQWKRATQTIDYIEQQNSKRLVVVAHGGLIKLALANAMTRNKYRKRRTPLISALKQPFYTWMELRAYENVKLGMWIDNAELVTARYSESDGWQVPVGYNQQLHKNWPYIGNLRPEREVHESEDET